MLLRRDATTLPRVATLLQRCKSANSLPNLRSSGHTNLVGAFASRITPTSQTSSAPALCAPRRLYATAPSSGGNASHHANDTKGGGGGSAGGSNSSSASSGVSGGTSGSHASGGSRQHQQQQQHRNAQAKKKLKIKKNKPNWRHKRKHGDGAQAAASTVHGSNHNSSSTGTTAGGAKNTSTAAGGSSGSGANATSTSSKGGRASTGGGNSNGSSSGSSAAARAKAQAKSKGGRRLRKKVPPRRTDERSKSTTATATATNSSSKEKGSSAAAAAASSVARGRAKAKNKKIRVCVLASSYEGADSPTAGIDNYWCTPQHYVKKDRNKYTFADVSVKKIDSYRAVRELVTSNKYDVFFNLCDGGRDEKRAGVDVVEALEEQNAAFTGSDSRSFEPSKIDMKLMVGSSGVKVPNFVLLDNDQSLAKKCRHLKFPVIVKALSGYASIGISKDSKCDNLEQLHTKVRGFIKDYSHALVEEFIRGREGTVLACCDTNSPFGVKVFKPLMFNFLQSNDDFAYFDKKWTMECNDQAYSFLPPSDSAYHAIQEMGRNAFKYIMNGVGYGRVDFRIDDTTGMPYFLEINPNCGMWYSPKDGEDFADVMVEGDPHWNHERFIASAVSRALRDQAARKPWYFISHDRHGQFSTRASKTVSAGKCLFGDAVHPIPVVSKALYKLGEEEPNVGCVICRGDGIHHAVALRHSCEPNMQFVHGRTLLFAAKRQISVGEELTVDYATLRDESMPHFACSCGTQNCRSVIFSMPATARTIEAKAAKRLLREKRQVWMREKAEREAEKILKKRSTTSASGGGGGGGGGSATTSSSAAGASSSGNSGNGSNSSGSSSASGSGGGSSASHTGSGGGGK